MKLSNSLLPGNFIKQSCFPERYEVRPKLKLPKDAPQPPKHVVYISKKGGR